MMIIYSASAYLKHEKISLTLIWLRSCQSMATPETKPRLFGGVIDGD